MAEQEQGSNGTIPPKVSPFPKPDGAAPVVPGAPRPITVRLKPVVPSASPEEAAAPEDKSFLSETSKIQLPVNPRATARVQIPDLSGTALGKTVPSPGGDAFGAKQPSAAPATVRLRPVAPAASPAPAVSAISAMHPQPPPAPGSHPLPPGPKPASGAQVQAAKSKTSRIPLDSAIGVAPVSTMATGASAPKTIRLKRPSDLASATTPAKPKSSTTPIRQTSRIPDSALPTADTPAASATSSVTQKKTLKIKRPGLKAEVTEEAGAEGEAFPEGVQMTPISSLDLPEKQASSVFTTIAVICAAAAAVVLVLLTLCLGAHAVGPGAGKNALASVPGPELPWSGRIAD